jgi:hypothetical protein
MILPPVQTTGGVGSPPAPTRIGCGCQPKDTEAVTQPTPSGPPPVAPVSTVEHIPAVMFLDRVKGLPWWVWVLAFLAASQAFNKGQARG